MYKRYISLLLILALLIVCSPSPVFADTGKSDITIVLRDVTDNEKNMGGAQFTLISQDYSTSAGLPPTGGTEWFPNVPHGTYTLTVTLSGYITITKTIAVSKAEDLILYMTPNGYTAPLEESPTPTPTPTVSAIIITPPPIQKSLPVNIPKPIIDVKNNDKADVLKVLGLFAGTDTGFKLEEPLLRVQGAIFLVKLLGKEADVKANNYTHPFTDVPAWANSYVGYLYQNKISAGIGGGKFGSLNLMTADEFTAFVLRAMGYVDKGYNLTNVILYAWMIGLVDNNEYQQYKTGGTFYRDDAILFMYNALKTRGYTPPATYQKYFAHQLVEQGAVNKELIIQSGLLANDVFSPDWVASTGPYTYNMNPNGDWEVYKDFFDVVDLGQVGNAKSSMNTFKLSRATYVCGFKAGNTMMMRFEDLVPVSYETHAKFYGNSAKNDEDALKTLNAVNAKPFNYFVYNGAQEMAINTTYNYIILCECTKDGMKAYTVLKRKYNFTF